MGALPKRKYAKSRQGKRRNHLGINLPSLDYCPQCNSPKLHHHVCPICGTYSGREVINVEDSEKKTE